MRPKTSWKQREGPNQPVIYTRKVRSEERLLLNFAWVASSCNFSTGDHQWMKAKGGEKIRGSVNKGEMFSGQKKEGSMVEAPKLAVRRRKAVRSVTREEIERYWRVKRMEEEEHLLAALKAAARIRARALSEEDYRRFEESLRDMIKKANEEKDGQNHKDLQVGIKDWWTKSRYAYLNQPAISKPIGEHGAPSKATAAYAPQKNCSYAPPPTCSPVPTSLGVF